MNVGYTNAMNGMHDRDAVCPLCGSDVYGSKYGGNFTCMNKECLLKKMSGADLIDAIKKIIKFGQCGFFKDSDYKDHYECVDNCLCIEWKVNNVDGYKMIFGKW